MENYSKDDLFKIINEKLEEVCPGFPCLKCDYKHVCDYCTKIIDVNENDLHRAINKMKQKDTFYKIGLEEGWELAKKMVFDGFEISGNDNTASIIEKLVGNVWLYQNFNLSAEEYKKKTEIFEFGDIVTIKNGDKSITGIILTPGEETSVIWSSMLKSVFTAKNKELRKTGINKSKELNAILNYTIKEN